MFMNLSERVYLNAGESFFPADTLNLLELIETVAYHVKVYRGELLYEQDECGRMNAFYHRTKKCIVRETNHFIDGLNEIAADESALSQVSITQINRLIRALKNRHGRITCYAIILIHVCLCLIKDNYDSNFPINQKMILKFMKIIHDVCEAYFAEDDDPLALFILQCWPVVSDEIPLDWAQMRLSGTEAFPPIPKRNPRSPDA